MYDSMKNLCFALFFVGGIVAAFAWSTSSGQQSLSWVRIAATVVSVAAVVGFLRLHFKPDRVPDYLVRSHKGSFENQGVCVAIEPSVADGIFYLNFHYQGKFAGDCVIHVGLRPKQGFLGRPNGLDLHLGPIDCPPAGFGVMRWPIPVPIKLQGKRIVFEVGLSATYPHGRGRQVRFKSRLRVLHRADFGRDSASNVMSVRLVTYRAAQFTIQLPKNVMEELPVELGEQDEVFWQLGDAPLA
jgi:hypothetical protein